LLQAGCLTNIAGLCKTLR